MGAYCLRLRPFGCIGKIYINGIEVPIVKIGASPLNTPIANNTTNFEIGERVGGTFPFKGNFDEFRIWNVARTAQEIANNFTVTINPVSETNLVSYYNFNQGTAGGDNTSITSLTDLKGSFNGTFNNFALNGALSNFIGSYAMTIPVANVATNISEYQFTANWTAPSIGTVDNYFLYIATDSSFSNLVSGYNPDTLSGNQTSVDVLNLNYKTNYYYKISAYNNGLNFISANSNIIQTHTKGTKVLTDTIYFSSFTGSKSFQIFSDFDWIISSSDTWLSFNNQTGSGDMSIIVSVEENTNAETRTGTITISSTNQPDVIVKIIQNSNSNPIIGSGTIADPYSIFVYDNLCQIDNVNYSWNAVYELMNDIDASASNSGAGFLPIGNEDNPFSGKFDGNGYSIKNLYINRPTSVLIGLFGSCQNAVISDLTLDSVYIVGYYFVGGLIALSYNCTITNCHINGYVEGSDENTGGIIAYSDRVKITNSSSKGQVIGKNNTGGLVGYITGTTSNIENCYSFSNVTGVSYVGGLVGYKDGGRFTNCFSTGDITGINSGNTIGGFCGFSSSNLIINNCYSTGNVYAPTSAQVGGFKGNCGDVVSNCYSTGDVYADIYTGGFAGVNNRQIYTSYSTGKVIGNSHIASFAGPNNTVINCVSNSQLSGQSVFANGGTQTNCYLKNTQEMKEQSTFSGFDFDTKWQIRENQTYPALRGINNAPFAFADTISKHSLNFSFSELLANDYDYETLQTALCLKIISVEAGTFNNENVILSNQLSVNTERKVVYRVGEIISAQDTLWGNRSVAVLTATNTKPVISSFDSLSTLKNTPIRILPANINFTDAENDQIQKIVFLPGDNYGFVGTSILPAYNYVGEIHVPVKISDGFEWSDSLIMTITVTQTNMAPVAFNSNISSRQGEALTTTLNTTDEDGYVTNLYVQTYPLHGTISISGWEITYYPNSEYFGTDQIQWFAIDNNGAFSNIATISITITQNTSPLIVSTAPTTATIGQEYTYEVIAEDTENDDLTYSLSNAPSGMILNNNIITWTPLQGVANSGIVTVTVSDGLLSDFENFIVFVYPVGIEDFFENEIIVYPNPTSDIFVIKNEELKIKKVIITDVTGKIIKYQLSIDNNQVIIDISDCLNGLYFLSIETERGITFEKILKQ